MPVVIGSQYEGALGALASIAFGAAFADTATAPVEATNFHDLANGPARRAAEGRRRARGGPGRPGARRPHRRGRARRGPDGGLTGCCSSCTWRSGCRPTCPVAEAAAAIKAREREYAQSLIARRPVGAHLADRRPLRQRQHLRRRLNDELHELLSGLPLFPYMDITVTALARHPSVIAPEERRPR